MTSQSAALQEVRRKPALDVPWDFSIKMWGYALWGPTIGGVLEFAACISEASAIDERSWDRDAKWLASWRGSYDGREVPTPEWWALPWVSEARAQIGGSAT